jgi:pimeloyl-ACP methyl ester carboxylesterase
MKFLNIELMKIRITIFIAVFILITCKLTFSQSAAVSPFDTTLFGRNAMIGKYTDINGIKMYYEIYGKGEPLLMIHGNGGSITSFLYQIPYFATHYQVIAVDSRAQGKSVDTGDSLSFEMMADDFSALLDKLNISSCYVLGWSDGGINGLMMTMRHPEKVKKLAVTGANLWPDSSAINSIDYLWGKNYYDTLVKMPKTPDILHTMKLVKLDLFQPHITTEQLEQIKCPSLIIGGDHDIIRPRHALLISESIPGAYLWILPNSSHSTLIDYHDRFNEIVGDFFAGRLKR